MKKAFLIVIIIFAFAFLGVFSAIKLAPSNEPYVATPTAKPSNQYQELIAKTDTLTKGYYYDEALELLKDHANNEKIATQIEKIQNLKNELVEYTGEIQHIFFHSLIIYTELAFDDIGHDKNGYNRYMATRDECLKLLPQLYERGYVLYNINDVFTKNADGSVVKNKIYLPKGKKPLILSQDDVSYYDYMKPDGFATRLLLDENGEVATEVKDPKGNVSITRDGDLVPIIDDFLKKYPDFSYRGAKGILALTGYEGVLGYRLKTDESKEEAKKVADAMKATGWQFASHSYTHNGKRYWGEGSTPANIQSDLTRWSNIAKPILGETNIFIAPFGYLLPAEGLKVVADNGYDIYCTVRGTPSISTTNPRLAIMSRFEIAGTNMLTHTQYVNEHFFNVESVIEKSRPPM